MTAIPDAPSPGTRRRALVAEGVSLARGRRTIQRELSFRLEGGQALLLTGANGTGKSTLLRALAGFLTPSVGRIFVDGADSDTPRAQLCHLCGHLDGIKAQLTVRENLTFWASFLQSVDRRGPGDDTVAAALSQFKLDGLAEIPAAYLSAGQKRRLGVARLLVAARPIWLLDEPTVSLDAASVALLLAAMSRHLADDGMIVAATHVALPLPGARELRLGGGATALAAESAGL